MTYNYARTIDLPFEAAVARITESLKEQGFGVLTEIDMAGTLKKKIGKEMPPYRILGACNPKLAGHAVDHEPRIGVMLPCNVIVRQDEDGTVEVAAINPVASMQAIGNPDLNAVAEKVAGLLSAAIDHACDSATISA
jgi:uncharacterized protein (DUF302 family)